MKTPITMELKVDGVMAYTLAQYLSAVTLTPFGPAEFNAFYGVSTAMPLVGYGDYGPNGPTPYVSGVNDNPLDGTGFTLIVDGNDVQVINGNGDDFLTATLPPWFIP